MKKPNLERPKSLTEACRQLYDVIEKLDGKVAASAGVSRNDLRCLNLLSRGPLKVGTITEELDLTSGGVSSLISRLEKINLVERKPDPEDRRGVLVHPTEHLFRTVGSVYLGVAHELEKAASSYSHNELRKAIKHMEDATAAFETALEDFDEQT